MLVATCRAQLPHATATARRQVIRCTKPCWAALAPVRSGSSGTPAAAASQQDTAAAASSHKLTAVGPKPCRSLHYVLKIGNRRAAYDFFVGLGMQVLRHEEFTEGCAAECNGPYTGMWSKTMMGYGDEDSHFVLELTYNYSVKSYDLGNDFAGITIQHRGAFEAAKEQGLLNQEGKPVEVCSYDGHRFVIVNKDVAGSSPITEVTLNVEDLDRALGFWHTFLGFDLETQTPGESLLRCGPGQTTLRLAQLPAGTKLDHGTGFGRIAFACPGEKLQQLESDVKAAGYKVHTPYMSLETPGKATVQVVILQDPDGYEICFVGDAGFRDLSQVDPDGTLLLAEALELDMSDRGMWSIDE